MCLMIVLGNLAKVTDVVGFSVLAAAGDFVAYVLSYFICSSV